MNWIDTAVGFIVGYFLGSIIILIGVYIGFKVRSAPD